MRHPWEKAGRPSAVAENPPGAAAYWAEPAAGLLARLGSGEGGLTAAEAAARRPRRGRHHRHPGWPKALLTQFTSPIMLILIVATVVSMVVGDVTDGAIIIAIIAASGLLGFAQEYRAGRDVAALMARVQVNATVLRDGVRCQVPVADVVPGDVVELSAGSLVPADCRLLASNGLLVDESVLTGESFPVDKDADAALSPAAPLADRANSVFFGTHVASGSGRAVAVTVGDATEVGRVKADLASAQPTTTYERGITEFGYLLVRMMLVLTAFIFVVNTLLGRPLLEALLFSLALAVGLTPQMLPAIVTIGLSSGARLMASRKVIVKRLQVIENLGSMSILCTDKTGTLTVGSPQLSRVLDVCGDDSDDVLGLASLNAGLQTGFANPMDAAILARRPLAAGSRLLGEVPYDFSRKRLSVITDVDGVPTLVVKGAYDGVLACCTQAATPDAEVPLAQVRDGVQRLFEQLSADGFRVLALATRSLDGVPERPGPRDERDLVLRGLLAFADPIKDTAADAVAHLAELGISMRLVTGDHSLTARRVAAEVGLPADRVLTGADIGAMSDAELAGAVRDVRVFAEIEPHAKRRVVLALRSGGAGVGFLGDGINDAPSLHAADVGISVDTAVDVAKEAASVVLLEKRLGVVIEGVRLGRRTFANTRKYVRLTTSANVGNVFSMAAASLFLPFLPLLPVQILLLNFLSDIPSLAIAGDEVDAEQTRRPATWDIREVRRFLVLFGAVSTLFDLVMFAVLIWGFHADADAFRSAWFIESTLSELLVLFSLRTARPMFRSRPAALLLGLSIAVGAVVTAIPFVPPVAGALALVPPALPVLAAAVAVALSYVAVNELVKRAYARG